MTLKAYINTDAISSYYIGVDGGDMKENIGQVEIYDENDNIEWESYKTVAEMQKRVNYINSHNFTWETLG